MRRIHLLTVLLVTLFSGSGALFAQQYLSYNACALVNAGATYYYNYHKTFNSVQHATHDVQLVVGVLACNPYATNTAGIKLAGTTFEQPNVPAGNCGYINTTYTIPMNIFNQAVTTGNGSITFDFYIRDQCAAGMGCSSASDPCFRINLTVDTSCVPTTGVANVTSCGPYTWINGTTYTSNNNTATHVLTNAGGCDSTVTLNLTIGDFTAPVPTVASLPNVTGQCNITTLTAPTANDNCAGTITGTHNATLPITASTTITWTYNDGNGNTSTQTQNAVINDVTAPVANATSLPALTSQCSITTLTPPTATDNCVGTITGTTTTPLPITASTTITWSYNDGHGNTSTQLQSVVINDVTAPVANVSSLPVLTAQCSITSLTAPTATDNCVGTVTGTHNATLPITASTTITWTYNDGRGNTSTQTQNVVINDITAPVANVSSLPVLTAQCSITTLTPPTATDNCVGTVTGTHNATLPITASTTITWTYNDGHGNTSTQTQSVVINDITAPVANASSLPVLTNQCSITSLTAPTATDNCVGTITGTHNAALPITASMTITWTYNDGHGNTSTQTQSVVINDVTAPVANASSLPTLTDQCSITALTPPTATDNCVGTVTGTQNATLPITASTTITWTYNDGHGNTSTQAQNVVINDVTAPVPTIAALNPVTSQCSITSLTAPTATDNCVGTVTGTHNATFPITASTTITWTYNDGHGNTSTQTQSIVINDITAPVADMASLPTLVAQCSITSLTAPTATDNCVGTVTGTHNATFPILFSGTITWTYNDGHGNTSTQTQNVVIDDVTAPVANAGSLPDITAQCSINSLIVPTATDNCAGTITGTPNVTLPITVQGTYTITWTFDDGNGNTSTQLQNIIIDDVTAPVANNAILAPVTQACSIQTLPAPTATDNCAGILTATPSVTFPITASTTIIWTYNDGNGNTSTQLQNVTVINDITPPVANAASLPAITAVCPVTELTAPTATDNCAGTLTGTHNATLPITTSTLITWTYNDGSGNTATQTQQITINPIDVSTSVTLLSDNQLELKAHATGYDYQWVEACGSDNEPISGANGQSYVPTSNGSYAVILDNGTCTYTSECIIIDNLGTDEAGTPWNVSLYPNPAQDKVTITVAGAGFSQAAITVRDLSGKELAVAANGNLANGTVSLDTHMLAPGVYVIDLRLDGVSMTKRMIIQ